MSRHVPFDPERHVPPAHGWVVRDDAFTRSRRTGRPAPIVESWAEDDDEREAEAKRRERLHCRAAERFDEIKDEQEARCPRVFEMAVALLDNVSHIDLTPAEAVVRARDDIGGNRNLTQRMRDACRNDPVLVELARELGYPVHDSADAA